MGVGKGGVGWPCGSARWSGWALAIYIYIYICMHIWRLHLKWHRPREASLWRREASQCGCRSESVPRQVKGRRGMEGQRGLGLPLEQRGSSAAAPEARPAARSASQPIRPSSSAEVPISPSGDAAPRSASPPPPGEGSLRVGARAGVRARARARFRVRVRVRARVGTRVRVRASVKVSASASARCISTEPAAVASSLATYFGRLAVGEPGKGQG